MKDKYSNDIKELVKEIERINKKEIEEANDLVNEIIRYNYKDEHTISKVFDKMLSIGFIAEEDIKKTYYKLLDYTKKINKELSDDYEEIFIEQFRELENVEF